MTESQTHAGHGARSMLYPPLDTPKPFAQDVWIVDSTMGPGLPLRMTIIRLGSGGLLLHSPTRYSAGLQRALEELGPIEHMVAPSSVHWMFAKAWQDAVPGAVTYGVAGLRRRRPVRRAGLRIDHELTDRAPAAWADEIELQVIAGGAGFREAVMFHRASRTVLMTDLMQNFEPGKLPWVLRPLAWALGNTEPTSRAPAHLRAIFAFSRRVEAAGARRIVAWRPERILVTHGRPIEQDAAGRLQRSLAWLTG